MVPHLQSSKRNLFESRILYLADSIEKKIYSLEFPPGKDFKIFFLISLNEILEATRQQKEKLLQKVVGYKSLMACKETVNLHKSQVTI